MPKTVEIALVLGVALLLTACSPDSRPHPGAPAFQAEARSGQYFAQRRLAECYADDQCVGVRHDAALACAWRGASLASRSPEITLADVDAYEAACLSKDETFRQRAAIAQENLLLAIYHRDVREPIVPRFSSLRPGALYPSPEMIREKVNADLALAKERSLPPFSAATTTAGGDLTWRACAGRICLDVVGPKDGGGVLAYTMTTQPADVRAAARFAAAALDAPEFATLLRGAPPAQVFAGGACWTTSVTPDRSTTVRVESGPCRAR